MDMRRPFQLPCCAVIRCMATAAAVPCSCGWQMHVTAQVREARHFIPDVLQMPTWDVLTMRGRPPGNYAASSPSCSLQTVETCVQGCAQD
eukprot:6059688-Alexandrium_andersonii.AAC.1